MTALLRLTVTEARLLWRDVMPVVLAIALPTVIILAWGSSPDIREPLPELGGMRPLEGLIAPIALSVVVASMALSVLPTALATLRDLGVLRRLRATPVGPQRLLAAQLIINVGLTVVGVVASIAVAAAVHGLQAPRQLASFVLAVLLGTVSMFSLGLLVAAVAPTASAATGIGMGLFFPLLLLGGVMVPREVLPAIVGRIGELTPLGGLVQALRDTWVGAGADPLHLAVMAVWGVATAVLAARLFRWD